MCCRLLWNIFGGSSARFYWKFIYISSEAELSFVDILPLSDEMGNIFSDPIEMSVLFCLCIVVSFTRMGWHRQYQYCASPGQDKNTDIWQDKVFILFLGWYNGRNSITQGLKRCVHFEVRLIIVFICSLPTIIYFVHRKESGKLVLLVFAPPKAININIIQ